MQPWAQRLPADPQAQPPRTGKGHAGSTGVGRAGAGREAKGKRQGVASPLASPGRPGGPQCQEHCLQGMATAHPALLQAKQGAHPTTAARSPRPALAGPWTRPGRAPEPGGGLQRNPPGPPAPPGQASCLQQGLRQLQQCGETLLKGMWDMGIKPG